MEDGGGSAKGAQASSVVLHQSLRGQLEGDLGLMSPCCEGHGNSQQPNVPFNGTLAMVEVVFKGSSRLGPSDLSHHIRNRDLEVLGLSEVRRQLLWPAKRP